MNTTFDTLAEALDALPVGPERIADHLAAMGVKAECRNPGGCAIAEYLAVTTAVPADHELSVGTVTAWLIHSDDALAPVERVELRGDVAEFVLNFDRGQYPDLVAGTPSAVAA